jgi:hypothetical protein
MTRTRAGLGAKHAAAISVKAGGSENETGTLRGLGHIRNTLRGLGGGFSEEEIHRRAAAASVEITCPACAVKADQVSPDLAACAALALMMVKGADLVRPTLCTMHARLFRLLVVEVEDGPKRLGSDGSSWED